MSTYTRGQVGEEYVVHLLEKKDYKVLKRNFRYRAKEVDIISVKDNTLIFIEVKNWELMPLEDIGVAVNKAKRKKIIDVSKKFLMDHPEYNDYHIRYDIISLTDNMRNIHHIQNAFMETGVS